MTDDRTPYQKRTQHRTGRRSLNIPDEVRAARRHEQMVRGVEARRRAWMDLADKYPDEFEAFFAQEKEGLARERGPLPGDDLINN